MVGVGGIGIYHIASHVWNSQMVIACGPLARSVLGLGMVALAIFMSTVSLGSAPYGWKSGLD